MTKYFIECLLLIFLVLLVTPPRCCQHVNIPAKRSPHTPYCPCEEWIQCDRIRNVDQLKQNGKEVIVMSADYSEPRKTWQHWDWPSISSVISEGDPDPTLMCYTHFKGRRYGFTGRLGPDLLQNNTIFESWLYNETRKATHNHIDLYLLDTLKVLSKNMTVDEVDKIANLVSTIRTDLHAIHPHISILCLVPWLPPCFETDCDFVNKMKNVCDLFMLSAESFLQTKNTHCIAQATVPFTKLRLGFDEFMISQVPPSKFIISVPWHGYSYLCDSFLPRENGSLYDQCFVKQKNGTNECDYDHSRKRLDMNRLVDHYGHYEDDNVWHAAYEAPYFNVKDVPSGRTKQIWYENYRSLLHKYIYIRQMNISGVALWSGNDLHYSKSKWFSGFNHAMWSWVLHGMLMQTESHEKFNENLRSMPKTMAAIGMSCIFIGGFLGFIFGWGVFRHTHKKNRRQPFDKDLEYMEEDQNL